MYPASILYKSTAGRYRPVSYPDGPISARYRFIKNAYWGRPRSDTALGGVCSGSILFVPAGLSVQILRIKMRYELRHKKMCLRGTYEQ